MNNIIGCVICETATTAKESNIIGTDRNDRVIIETILQDMDVKNRNGRYYAKQDLTPALNDARMKELIEKKSLFGEAGHPMSKDLARQQTIDINNMSHRIMKLWTDGNDIKAHVKGTVTKLGEDFNNYILDGTIPAFSLRALGSIKNTHKGAEVKNIRIITWDWVIYPSHKRAYMEKIADIKEASLLNESNNLLLQENDQGLIIPITNDKVANAIKNESGNVYSVLESFIASSKDVCILDKNKRHVQVLTEDGNKFVVNLENHIQNKIMKYCNRL